MCYIIFTTFLTIVHFSCFLIVWVWSDDSENLYDPWYSQLESFGKDCALMLDGGFTEQNCFIPHPFICEVQNGNAIQIQIIWSLKLNHETFIIQTLQFFTCRIINSKTRNQQYFRQVLSAHKFYNNFLVVKHFGILEKTS